MVQYLENYNVLKTTNHVTFFLSYKFHAFNFELRKIIFVWACLCSEKTNKCKKVVFNKSILLVHEHITATTFYAPMTVKII